VSEFVATLAPVVAVIASVIGVVGALDQLTLRARVRRIADWSGSLAADETNSARRAALCRTRTWASGQLVASVMVPARYYLEGLCWAVVAPTMTALTRYDDSGLAVPIFALVATALSLRRTIRVHCERHRIVREYFNGWEIGAPRPFSMLFLMEGGKRIEHLWAWLGASGLVCVGYSARQGLAGQSNWAMLLIAGLFVSGVAYSGVRLLTPTLLVGDVPTKEERT